MKRVLDWMERNRRVVEAWMGIVFLVLLVVVVVVTWMTA